MTIAEVEREITATQKRQKAEKQEKALFDYTLADLIGRSVSRIYSKSNTMPDIIEVYPKVFDVKEIEEKKQENKNMLSALRFKQFANFHNKKFKEGGN